MVLNADHSYDLQSDHPTLQKLWGFLKHSWWLLLVMDKALKYWNVNVEATQGLQRTLIIVLLTLGLLSSSLVNIKLPLKKKKGRELNLVSLLLGVCSIWHWNRKANCPQSVWMEIQGMCYHWLFNFKVLRHMGCLLKYIKCWTDCLCPFESALVPTPLWVQSFQ